MTNEFGSNRLADLRARADRSLRRFARNRLAVTRSSLTSGLRQRRPRDSSGRLDASRPANDRDGPGFGKTSLAAAGTNIDDERQVRAVAKELKRLIVEDRRRGLSIGG